jgi:REP element-mobilizing transposase RayT
VTPVRQIDAGVIFYVTVRAVNRSFRFVPKRKIREALRYCLAAVLEEYRSRGDIELYEFQFMSNHFHLLGKDVSGCVPNFMTELNSLISRQLNAIRGISGRNIEQGYGLVRLVGAQRIANSAVYTLANPVAAFLVARARHWRSVSSLNMEYGVPVAVEQPKTGLWAGKCEHASRQASQRSKRAEYAGRSKLPAVALLVLDRPPIMREKTDSELREHIRTELAKREQEIEQQRLQLGRKVLGWSRVQQVHFLAIPGSEELFARNPTVAASTVAERIVLIKIRRAFLDAYARAREAYRAGDRDAAFPIGTWKMARWHHARCVPLVVP